MGHDEGRLRYWFLAFTLSLVGLPAIAQCPPFHDTLHDAQSVEAHGGVIQGNLDFIDALTGPGAHFTGSQDVRYTNPAFSASSGSVAVSVQKSSQDMQGGVLQIGELNTPNSVGVFYQNESDLCCTIQTDRGFSTSICAPAVFVAGDFTRVTVTWHHANGIVTLKFFVDGWFVDYAILPGPFVPETDFLDLGRAGAEPAYGRGEGVFDELTFYEWATHDAEIYADYVFTSSKHRLASTEKPISTGPVQVVNETLLVNGEPFTVKGVGYQPVPVGYPISRETLDLTYTDPCILQRDIALLRQLGVNTIRTWSELPNDSSLLDALYNNGVDPIYAILGFWVSMNADYGSAAVRQQIVDDFTAYVSTFKDHPAVLAWGLGNENNLAYSGDVSDWYLLANELALAAYAVESPAYHPTVVINGDMRSLGNVDLLSDDESLAYVDLWGQNAYLGYDDGCYFELYNRISSKPLVITEFGIDAFDNAANQPYESVQADWVVTQWRLISEKSLGGTLMAYSDEWWKANSPATHDDGGYYTDTHPDGFSNEEWWGLIAVEENGPLCDIARPREAFTALSDEFGLTMTPNGDFDEDGDVDLDDWTAFEACFDAPPRSQYDPACRAGDFDRDGDLDCDDWTVFVHVWTGPGDLPPLALCVSPIPTTSAWSLTILALVVAVGGTIMIRGDGPGSYCGVASAPSFPRRRSSSARIS